MTLFIIEKTEWPCIVPARAETVFYSACILFAWDTDWHLGIQKFRFCWNKWTGGSFESIICPFYKLRITVLRRTSREPLEIMAFKTGKHLLPCGKGPITFQFHWDKTLSLKIVNILRYSNISLKKNRVFSCHLIMNTIIAFLLLSFFFSVKYFFLSSFSPHFHVLLSLSSPSSGWTDPASFPTRLTSEFKYSVHVTSRT